MREEINFKIKEKSWLAKIAGIKLNKSKIAMVWGSTILLSGVSKTDFLKNERWLKHELEHVRQFKRYGFVRFICKYMIETIRKGYYNNKFEMEARAAEAL